MKISEIITDKYKLRIPPTVYYELLADVQEVEEEQEPTTKIDCNKTDCNKCVNHKYCDYEPTTKNDLGVEHHKQNIQAYAHDFGVSEEQAEKELRVTTKNDLGVDCISRQAVIDLMMQKWGENFSGDSAMQESIDAIRVMPSVTSQEPILDKLRAELHATAEMNDDGDYYLREEWIDEYFDKYKAESEAEDDKS